MCACVCCSIVCLSFYPVFFFFFCCCCERSRTIREFDFQVPMNLGVGNITPNFIQWRLCLWAGRAPGLVTEIVRLMDKRVPLWVIEYICQKSENGEQTRKQEIENLLQAYRNMLFKAMDVKEDAVRALVIFVSKLRLIMDDWNDGNDDCSDENNGQNDSNDDDNSENSNNNSNSNNNINENSNNENNENNGRRKSTPEQPDTENAVPSTT